MRALHPGRYGHGPDPASLPGHVGQHPAAFPLLEIFYVDPEQLGPAQSAAEQQGQDRPVAKPGQGAGRRGVEEIVGLFLHQPVPCPVAALLDARHALDRRGHGRVEQLIVGHLAGELADRREPEVDRRGGKALGQERRPVLLDQGLGERRPCPRDPDPAKEGRQPRPVGAPGVDGGDAIEDQIDQPGLGVRVPCRSGLNLEFCVHLGTA